MLSNLLVTKQKVVLVIGESKVGKSPVTPANLCAPPHLCFPLAHR